MRKRMPTKAEWNCCRKKWSTDDQRTIKAEHGESEEESRKRRVVRQDKSSVGLCKGAGHGGTVLAVAGRETHRD